MGTPKTLVIIEGPTGVGKTDVGIEVALSFDAEIISADSRQFYKELSIGTAKPTIIQQQKVKHHFIDCVSVFDYYNVYMFEQAVQQFLLSYFETRDVCVMVGGSGMYIDAVCNGIDLIPDIDEHVRNSINKLYREHGLVYLQNEVLKIDKPFFSETDINNPARLIRALEVFIQTGKRYSDFRVKNNVQRNYSIIKIALVRDRNELYNRINQRTLQMINDGLEQEARLWYSNRHLNALQTVGYKELFEYFDGNSSKNKAIENIQQNTRRYAKKQVTWFKKDPNTMWLNASDVDSIKSVIKEYL